jgi:hypothetical protein
MFYDVVTSPSAVLRICLGVLRDVTVLEPYGLARWSVAARHSVCEAVLSSTAFRFCWSEACVLAELDPSEHLD